MASPGGDNSRDGGLPEPRPGLLTLRKLVLNKGEITRSEEKQINRTLEEQEHYLVNRIHSQQFTHAVRNLKGLLFFHSHRKCEAINLWRQTVALDPSNLNALKDLATAYRKLRSDKTAAQYELRLDQAMKRASLEERQLMLARCQIEHAYAQFSDLYGKVWTGVEQCQMQVRSFEAVFEMPGGLIHSEKYRDEKKDWLLYTGKAHERLCHAYFRAYESSLYIKSLQKATEYLHTSMQLSGDGDEHSGHRVEVWVTIGNTFTRNMQQKVPPVPEVVQKNYYKQWQDPSLCYENALGIDPDSLWAIGRLGVYWWKQKDYQKALLCFHKAINVAEANSGASIEHSCVNSLYHRARVYLQLAKRADPEHARDFLLKAKEDLARAADCNYRPTILLLDGEVHRHLARNESTEAAEKEELRCMALDRFYEASASEDGSQITTIHLQWAKCLLDTEDLPSAIESYKIAFETGEERIDRTFINTLAKELLNTMLQNYQNEGRQPALRKEVAFWFVYIHSRCTKFKVDFALASLQWDFASEILDVMEYIITTNIPCHYKDMNNLHVSTLVSNTLLDISNWQQKKKFVLMLGTSGFTDFKNRLSELRTKHKCNLRNPNQTTLASTVQSHFHRPPQSPLAEGYDYDFNVINAEDYLEVDGWVQHSLLTGLESPFYGLKGYYHNRDASPGFLDTQARVSAIERSANTLIVISHGFDARCDLLIEVAQLLKGREVIILQREHVSIPDNLRVCRKFDFTLCANIPELVRYLMPVITKTYSTLSAMTN